MEITLGIAAIILAIIAIIPYVLEVLFWFFRKPKLVATIHQKECTHDTNTGTIDVKFWLGIALTRGCPAIFRNLQLILPIEAEPYKHPHSGEVFQKGLYVKGAETRYTLILNVPYHPESFQYTKIFMIAFKIPMKNHSVNLDLIAEVEIDEARLGFWAIFYHPRHHLKTLTISLDLDQPNLSKLEEFVS